MSYRLWTNPERTILFRVFEPDPEADDPSAVAGLAEVAFRDTPAHTWGPPVRMVEEKT